MAATPPLQVLASPETPATPLHGAAYERKPIRQQRESQLLSQEQQNKTVTPRKAKTWPSANAARPQSPPLSTPRRASRRVHVMPPGFETELSPPKPSNPARHPDLLLPSTTTMSEGMLPTPVKTPSKKKAAAAAAATAGRALFQDLPAVAAAAPSPRRARKNKRYNGFSLESFAAATDEDGQDGAGIQIFTDNRDKVPEPDTDQSNPFVDGPESESRATASRARKSAGSGGGAKARRERKLDPQVEEAIRKDEGMVYVFRGKKVYRRFDDSFEEEEVIDDQDLGLLQHTEEGATRAKPLKTLTRKSVKPTRLFQQEVQRRARDRAKEEEAPTDIEQDAANDEDDDDKEEAEDEAEGECARTIDVGTKRRSVGLDPKSKASPFDAWPRVKPGTRSMSAAKKRSADEAQLSDEPGDPVAAAAPSSSLPSGTTPKQRKTRTSAF
ncbi:hypothetical protein DV737_g5401, partial [Chaetothyriales sp. CBS 132003]